MVNLFNLSPFIYSIYIGAVLVYDITIKETFEKVLISIVFIDVKRCING